MNIVPEGLEPLARLVVSCEPLGMKNISHEAFIVERAKAELSVDVGLFMEKFPSIEMYPQLVRAATESEKECIDADVVYRFFGGRGHVEKVLGDIDNVGGALSTEVQHRILFLHMLIPVSIIEQQGDLFVGRYADEKHNITIIPLHVFQDDTGKIRVGTQVLAHFSSVIMINPSEALSSWLLEEQRQNQLLQEAVASLEGKTIRQPQLCEHVRRTAQGFGW
jgi:hypothetical protein